MLFCNISYYRLLFENPTDCDTFRFFADLVIDGVNNKSGVAAGRELLEECCDSSDVLLPTIFFKPLNIPSKKQLLEKKNLLHVKQ